MSLHVNYYAHGGIWYKRTRIKSDRVILEEQQAMTGLVISYAKVALLPFASFDCRVKTLLLARAQEKKLMNDFI